MIINWDVWNIIGVPGITLGSAGEHEMPVETINLHFRIGDNVYLKEGGNTKYVITSYLGDNEHYILNNEIRVSYTQITRYIDGGIENINKLLTNAAKALARLNT